MKITPKWNVFVNIFAKFPPSNYNNIISTMYQKESSKQKEGTRTWMLLDEKNMLQFFLHKISLFGKMWERSPSFELFQLNLYYTVYTNLDQQSFEPPCDFIDPIAQVAVSVHSVVCSIQHGVGRVVRRHLFAVPSIKRDLSGCPAHIHGTHRPTPHCT